MSAIQPVGACNFDGELLARFADGTTSSSERSKVLKHLLSGCEACRTSVAPKIRLMPAHRPSEFSISRVLSNVADFEHQMNQERQLGTEQLREFLRHPPARQWTLLRNSSRFDSWSFCELLLDAGVEVIFNDPHRALEYARMGVAIAERLGADRYGERLIEDLRARAWGRTANALRATSDLTSAEQALATAARHLKKGTGEPLEEAEHLYYSASLLRAQRRLNEALRNIHRARRIYRMVGDRHLEGRAMMCESTIHDLRGDVEKSIAVCRQAMAQIDSGRSRQLAFAVRHNLVWQLMVAGKSEEALIELEAIRPAYFELGNQMLILRLRWMEARLAKDLGRPAEAEKAFREAHEGFLEARIPYEAASVALDLAVMLAEQGRRQELKVLASELVAVFRTLGVAREAFVALTLFERLAQSEAVTLSLLSRLSQYISQVQQQPHLRFDPKIS